MSGGGRARAPVQAVDSTASGPSRRSGTAPGALDHAPKVVAQLARQREMFGAALTPPPQMTGPSDLPAPLQARMEALSGVDLSGVRVHRNSDRPATLGAQAFAQGQDIHLGPGQERHLPHEAWHVVQQAQGRVAPTLQAKGLAINDDPALEAEADRMGAAAMAGPVPEPGPVTQAPALSGPLQAQIEIGGSFRELLENQQAFQAHPYGTFTTVGFEHEFAQMTDGPLLGVTHVDIANSTETLPYTGLGFSLETDADNALELVSPPFLVDTLSETSPVPDPADIAKIDRLIKTTLEAQTEASKDIGELVDKLKADPKLDFGLKDAQVTSSNINPETKGDFSPAKNTASQADLRKAKIRVSRKSGHVRGISSQVNFAADAGTYSDLKSAAKPEDESNFDKLFLHLEAPIHAFVLQKMQAIHGAKVARLSTNGVLDGNMRVFLRELARGLAQQMAVDSITTVETAKTAMFDDSVPARQMKNKLKTGKDQARYQLHTGMRSHVKDVRGIWLKDTLANFGLGLLTPQQWGAVLQLTHDSGWGAKIDGLSTKGIQFEKDRGFTKTEMEEIGKLLPATRTHMKAAVTRLGAMILAGNWQRPDTPTKGLVAGPDQQPAFGTHDPAHIGARQDTFIPTRYVNAPGGHSFWDDRRMHVLEARGDAVSQLVDLHLMHLIRADGGRSDADILDAYRDLYPEAHEDHEELTKEVTVERIARLRATIMAQPAYTPSAPGFDFGG